MGKPERFTLKHPVDVEGETVETVSLRRPKVRDMRAIEEAKDEGEIGQTIALIAAITGLKPEIIEEFDAEDYVALSERIADFFPQGQPQGRGGP